MAEADPAGRGELYCVKEGRCQPHIYVPGAKVTVHFFLIVHS